jgi:hypothetical protein
MMKSKEEMIEAMAVAIYASHHADVWRDYPPSFRKSKDKIQESWDKGIIDAYGGIEINKKVFLDKAEAALKALCGALPDVEYKDCFVTGDTPRIEDNATELYNQLKQWGK